MKIAKKATLKKLKSVNGIAREVQKKSSKKQSNGKSFKSELAELAENDPEFFEYLKNEEADILEFSDHDEAVENGDSDNYGDDVADDFEHGTDSDDQPDNTMDDLTDEKEDDMEIDDNVNFNATSCEQLSSGKNLSVKIYRDAVTRKKIVDEKLVEYLVTVLADPIEHRPALAAATRTAVKCFEACVCSLGGGETQVRKQKKTRNAGKKEKDDSTVKNNSKKAAIPQITSEFVVKREDLFDDVLQLCFTHMGRCLMIILNPIEKKNMKSRQKKKKGRNHTTTFKHWHKHGALAKQFLNALCALLAELQHNDNIICAALNAVCTIVDLYLHFPRTSKQLIKTTVRLWSRRHENVQSAAFLVLCKFLRISADTTFSLVYKTCYVAYISNCKQVNFETKPQIEFMQKCFVELSFLAPKMAYEHAFVYIRQFAIHLRTAIMGKKKDFIPSVYNWQFLNGLSLWSMVIAHSAKEPANFAWFRDLLHPLIEITILLERSFMSRKYISLGVFCIRLLLRLQKECNVFIPTLSMSLELLNKLLQIDKTKPKAGKGTEKAVDVTETLRLSDVQLQEAGIRLALAQQIFNVSVECSEVIKNNPAFPEILIPLEPKLKNFIKNSRNPDHVEMFKTMEKILRNQAAKIAKVVSADSWNLKNMEL